MKVKFKSNDFQRALKLCANATEVKDTIRSNIQFEADSETNKMKLMAVNNQYSIEVLCDCDVSEDGVAVVDGKMAYSVIAKSSSDCSITTDDKSMIIKASGRTKIPNIGTDLPVLPRTSGGSSVTFDSIAFKNAISKIAYAISEDESRPILTGAHIVTEGNEAVFTGLDGFKLAQTSILCNGEHIDAVVPTKILIAVCDAIDGGNLIISHNGTHITFSGDNFCVNAITLSGDYIDTARIIPTSFKTNVLVQTDALRDCMNSATVASGASNLVKVCVESEKLTITSNSQDADFSGDVSAVVDGDMFTIAFNLKYFVSVMNHIDTEECELHLNSPVSPIVIIPHTENTKDMSLLLPVRVFS